MIRYRKGLGPSTVEKRARPRFIGPVHAPGTSRRKEENRKKNQRRAGRRKAG